MIRPLAALLLVMLPLAAHAGETLDSAEIKVLLTEAHLYGNQNGAPSEQIFRASGQTIYLVNGVSSAGTWETRGNKYCSMWPPNPAWTCYNVTTDGESVTFISRSGALFRMTKLPPP